RQRLDRIVSVVEDLIGSEEDSPSEMDAWILSRFNNHLASIRSVMDRYDLRQMATIVYFDMLNDIKWYQRRGGRDRGTLNKVLRIWIQAMMPVTPHVAEELWNEAGFEGLVSAGLLPEADGSAISADAEYAEELLKEVMTDVSKIRKIADIEPKRLIIYTTPAWKVKVIDTALQMSADGDLSIPNLTKRCMSDETIKKNGKTASELAKKVTVDIQRSEGDNLRRAVSVDEYELLTKASEFLSTETSIPTSVMRADEEGLYDPAGKAKAAAPGRPAIYLE
ncbi:MAG: class I tRNA ligase family protein, partial [Candidatus Methanomethylophilaceae archaeon]|nr:class I tRNA ligase family protein [Candidatus Methanomethylophilaceae archaeon]